VDIGFAASKDDFIDQIMRFTKILFVILGSALLCGYTSPAFDARGGQFIGFESFKDFKKVESKQPGEVIMESPEIVPSIQWDELVASWNVESPAGTYLKIDARPVYSNRVAKYYTMGLWSEDPKQYPRESVLNQKDEIGDVNTDTLILKEPCRKFRIRLTLGSCRDQQPRLKFVGICLTDTKAHLTDLKPNRAAWGKVVPVIERSQMVYPGGEVWCSPTTVSMIMTYWSQKLHRPELDHDVPEIVKQVFDPKWDGTGNWPFNTAYAGSFPKMRAYVARLSDISELEDWIASGIPVGLSISYNRLRGRTGEPSGHLVVCVGFTKEGDVILNDPGTTKNVQKTFPRKNLIDAMAYTKNAVYLIYPEDSKTPRDRFGHWDSQNSRKHLILEKTAATAH
jgi:Peptidase_C39 like family